MSKVDINRDDWVQKVWGVTREVIYTDFYAKYELSLITGGFCSLHYHEHRANRFWVRDATVEIIEWYGPKVVRHVLGPDNAYDVPSLVPHIFVAREGGFMVEEYYPDRGGHVKRDDIVRLTQGGKIDDKRLEWAFQGANIVDHILERFHAA